MFASIRHLLLITIFAGCCFGILAQRHGAPSSGGRRLLSDHAADTVKKATKPGSAWTLSTPLGDHQKSTIDTLLYNYQRQFIPSQQSDAYATTGALGSEGINMLFLQRAPQTTFFFDDALAAWLPSLKTMKFYNVYTPMTLLSYNYGGTKQNHQDRLDLKFAGNVNRRIGIGVSLDYLYSKGFYEDQAVKNFNFGFNGYYLGDRYEMQALYYHFNSVNKENGGITDDLYITDPAEVQGGVANVEAKSIPVNLSDAHTRLRGDRLFTTHALKFGYWREEQVNDTLTRDIYIPVTKIIYSLDYEGRHHMFRNTNAQQGQEFWENRYFDPDATDDDTRYWSVMNTLGVKLLEGFRKWAKFGIDAYATIQTRKFTQANYYYDRSSLTEEQLARLTPLPEGFSVPDRIQTNRGWVGGRISKRQGAAILYDAHAKFGVLGVVAGDLNLSGNVESNFRLFGDTVTVKAYGGFDRVGNSYLLNNYVSNHFIWQRKLAKTSTVSAGGSLHIPWTKTNISAGFRNISNYVYFDSNSIPAQYGGNIQVFSASLDQKLRFGIWNWNNTITYQATSNSEALPLPSLTVYSNMFLNFKAFRVLTLNIGVDCDYYTSYYGLMYQPATMSFHVQRDQKVGNYAFCNAYLSAKLYKVRFYLLWSHVNQGWFGKNYFSMPHYPVGTRTIQLGLSIDFAD